MPGVLTDANLPYRVSLWRGDGHTQAFDIGGMRIRELFAFLHRVWPQGVAHSTRNTPVIVGATHIEGIA